MKINILKDELYRSFENKKSFTITDIYNSFSKIQSNIKRSTVNWRIHHLVQQGMLQRIGRGVYRLGRVRPFVLSLSSEYQVVSSVLKEQFPLVTYSLWHTDILKEFSHHISNINFFLVEVDREAVDSVYNSIKEINKNTFRKPSQNMMEDLILGYDDTIVIKPLISESPIQVVDGISVPCIEKILVDLFADKDLFFYLEGNELFEVVTNVFNKYTVNVDSLLRYAGRRGKKQKMKTILDQINGNSISN